MDILLTASTVFTLLALYFLFAVFRNARRRRPVRATGSLAGSVASGAAGGASILLVFSYYGYDRLTDEPRRNGVQVAVEAHPKALRDARADNVVSLERCLL